jgi:phytoene synthase
MKKGKKIQRTQGKEYYAATKHLPAKARDATYRIYGFVKTVDDLVDKPRGKTTHEQRSAVEDYRRRTIAAIKNPAEENDEILIDFVRVVREYNIPELEVHAFLDAMASDAYKKAYKDLGELQHYLRGSAAAVANMMLTVTKYNGEREAVRKQARALAEALKMTDILCDVSEDYHALGRVYLPQSIMQKHGATEEDIKKKRASPGIKRTIHELSVWTRNQYHEGVGGIKHLPKDCRFAVLLATVLHLRLLDKVEKSDYDPFSREIKLGAVEKKLLTASTWLRYKVLGQSELRVCKLTHNTV